MNSFKSIFHGFPFVSKEQLEREEREFKHRIFPLGMEQREYAAAVLSEVMPEVKNESDRLYAFIAAKDTYVQEYTFDAEHALALARNSLQLMRWKNPNLENLILALIMLEIPITSFEEYPTADMVRQKAKDFE